MQYFIYINYTQNIFFYSHTTNEWFASCIDNFYSRFIKRYNTVAQKCRLHSLSLYVKIY